MLVLDAMSGPGTQPKYDPEPIYIQAVNEYPQGSDARLYLANYYMYHKSDARKALTQLDLLSPRKVGKRGFMFFWNEHRRMTIRAAAMASLGSVPEALECLKAAYASPFPKWLSEPDCQPLGIFRKQKIPVSPEDKKELWDKLLKFKKVKKDGLKRLLFY